VFRGGYMVFGGGCTLFREDIGCLKGYKGLEVFRG